MSATNLASLLEPLRTEAERKIKEQLSGPKGLGMKFIYDTMMPINLNITGGDQECYLEFLAGGNVQLHSGLAGSPDVSVKGDLESLRNVILQRSSRLFEEAERSVRIVATAHSWKGQQAMQKVREILTSNP